MADKIKKRSLDEELIKDLESSLKKGSVVWTDLSQDLQKQLLATGSGASAEVIAQAIKDIDGLKSTKADLSMVQTDYLKRNEPNSIDSTMFDKSTQAQLNRLNEVLTNVDGSISTYLDTNPILIKQLSAETVNLINAPNAKIDTIQAALGGALGDITDLKKSNTDDTTAISDMKAAVAADQASIKNIQTEADTNRDNIDRLTTVVSSHTDSISNINSSITNLETSMKNIEAGQVVAEDNLSTDLKNKIKSIDTLSTTVNTTMNNKLVVSGSVGKTIVSDGANWITAVDFVRHGTIVHNTAEETAARTTFDGEILCTYATPGEVLLAMTKSNIANRGCATLYNQMMDSADTIKFKKASDGTVTASTGAADHTKIETAATESGDGRMYLVCDVTTTPMYTGTMFMDDSTGEIVMFAPNVNSFVTICPAKHGHIEATIAANSSQVITLPIAWIPFNVLLKDNTSGTYTTCDSSTKTASVLSADGKKVTVMNQGAGSGVFMVMW